MAKRCTRKEATKRIETIARMLVNGANGMEATAYIKREWGLSKSTADHYLRQARQMIRESCEIDRADFVSQKLNTLELVIRKGLETNQLSNVIGAAKLACELTGSIPK